MKNDFRPIYQVIHQTEYLEIRNPLQPKSASSCKETPWVSLWTARESQFQSVGKGGVSENRLVGTRWPAL